MDITVRVAHPEDHQAAGRLSVAAYLADGLVADTEDGYARTLRDAADRAARATLLVATTSDGVVVGTVTYAETPPYAQIARPDESEFRMLAVAPEARGQGCGELLVRACLELATEHGRRAVVLSTTGKVAAATRLYERVGFVAVPERDWQPVPGITLLVYRRELAG